MMPESAESKQRRIDIARAVVQKRRAELTKEALELRLNTNWKRLGEIAEEFGRLIEEEEALDRGIITHYCCVCHKNPVDADSGFDTCGACLAKQ